MKDTSLSDIPDLITNLRSSVTKQTAHAISFRKRQLHQLTKMLYEKRNDFVDAMVKDLKSTYEASLEVSYCIGELTTAITCIDEWTRPKKFVSQRASAAFMFDSMLIKRDPLGLVLVISPWNYPVILLILPVIGAIAAGNCVIMKPSEISGNTANCFAENVPKYLDPACYCVVKGDSLQVSELLKYPMDHVLFTGGGRVGKIVYEKAANFLTPVTLELGGKCPTIVTRNFGIKKAAKRILYGKWFNAGQTCVAPDYVLCDEKIHDELVHELIEAIKEFKGMDDNDNGHPTDYGLIINDDHVKRLKSMLSASSSKILYNGVSKQGYSRQWLTTIVSCSGWDDPVMKDEIFGPILPIITFKSLDEAIDFVNQGDKPLTLYMFSEQSAEVNRVLEKTSSGTACINDTFLHLASPLPFGGVGNSGFGSYKGYRSFETFSHEKRVLWRPAGLEYINNLLRYPPFSAAKTARLLRFVSYEPQDSEIQSGSYYVGIGKFFSILYNIFIRPLRS